MKKVVILVMSCNQDERFLNEEDAIRKTWGKDILDGKYNNINLIFYRGGYEEDKYDRESNILYLKSDDTLNGTYHKTINAFKFVDNNFNYDYIVRTNTSTYINVEAILQFLASSNNYYEYIIGPKLCINNINYSTPFIGGHFVIFGRDIINILINNKIEIRCGIDDIVIGYMLGKIFKTEYTNHLLHVDGLNIMCDDYLNKLNKVFCIKLKDGVNDINIITNMFRIHKILTENKNDLCISLPNKHFKYIETEYGTIISE